MQPGLAVFPEGSSNRYGPQGNPKQPPVDIAGATHAARFPSCISLMLGRLGGRVQGAGIHYTLNRTHMAALHWVLALVQSPSASILCT